MPLLEITTNTVINNSPSVAEQASKLITEILNKPESYVMIKIVPEQTLIFSGNNEPAAHIKLKSLGLAEDSTAYFSEKICSFISSQLNINSARIYIEFFNPARHMWGWDGKTF